MAPKRQLEGGRVGDGSGPGSPSPTPAEVLKKRCRSFDLEIRGCRHLQELFNGMQRRLEATIQSTISRIPEEVTKALTSFLSRAPSLCRTPVDHNEPPRYRLRFMNGLSGDVFTRKAVCTANGDPLKISLEECNQQASSSHRLRSAKIRIVVLDGDFNKDNNESWKSEDFSNHIVLPRDKAGAVLTGKLELSLKNGEACLRGATFIDNSTFTRSRMFRLGVMVTDEIGERVQEGITEPFTVKDRRGEVCKKHAIPSLDDDVWRLKNVSKGGISHKALKDHFILHVKDFLRLYHKDEHALRKILSSAKDKAWTTTVNHAKMCDPGKELYSFLMESHNVILFFNSVYRIVGVTIGGHYTPFSDLDKRKQDLVKQWSKDAYEKLTCHQPDYEMNNGKSRPINPACTFKGSSMLEDKITDLMHDHINEQKRTVHETNYHQGTSNSHPNQCSLKRLGSIRVTQNNEDSPIDFNVYLDSGSEQCCASTAANDITGSVTLHCPTTSANETTGPVLVKQASLTFGHEAYNVTFANSDASVHQLCQEPPLLAQCNSSLYSADAPIFSRLSSFTDQLCEDPLVIVNNVDEF